MKPIDKNLFTKQPERSWEDYSKEIAFNLSVGTARCSTWLLYEALNTPFGLCIYTLCCTYGWYGTSKAVFFSSQTVAFYYVVALASLSLILFLLMLFPPMRAFLYLQVGEEVIKKRVGASGIRPLIAAVVGPFFLFFLDYSTRQQLAAPDVEHWREISDRAQKVRLENISHSKDLISKLDTEYASLLEAAKGFNDPDQLKQFLEENKSTVDTFRDKEKKIIESLIYKQAKINQDALELSMSAVKPPEKVGSVTEVSDRIKDFLRGKEKNRSLWVIDRSLPGSMGLDRYDSAINTDPDFKPDSAPDFGDLRDHQKEREMGLDPNHKQGKGAEAGIEKK